MWANENKRNSHEPEASTWKHICMHYHIAKAKDETLLEALFIRQIYLHKHCVTDEWQTWLLMLSTGPIHKCERLYVSLCPIAGDSDVMGDFVVLDIDKWTPFNRWTL